MINEVLKLNNVYAKTELIPYKDALKQLDCFLSITSSYLSQVSGAINSLVEDYREFISDEEVIALKKACKDVDCKMDLLCGVLEEIFQNHLKRSKE